MNAEHGTAGEAAANGTVSPARLWRDLDPGAAYTELSHPADLFLEIRGSSLADLSEHALYALFDNLVELNSVEPRQTRTAESSAVTPAEAIRRLVAEALVLFYTERFLVAGGSVKVSTGTPGARSPGTSGGTFLTLSASLWGEVFDPGRHELLTEIKAVTRHQMVAERDRTGRWRATMLLDV